MNPSEPDDIYEKWRSQRSQDFSSVELSCLVMASVRRRPDAGPPARPARLSSYFEAPSYLIRAARFFAVLLLILAPL